MMNSRMHAGAERGARRASRTLPLTLALALVAGGCSRPAPPSPTVIRPVKTRLVSAGEDTRARTFSGRVEASNKVELAFQVGGILVSLPVREGQKVAKGEVVAQLRQDEFQARLTTLQSQLDGSRAALQALQAGVRPEERLRLEAQVRSAEATLVNARTESARFAQLFRTRAVSAQENDRVQTAYRVAQEDFKAARQMLEQGTIAREEDIQAKEAEVRGLESRVVEANLQLSDSTLRAPYDGVIAQRFVEQGQNIRPLQPIVKFQDVDEVTIVLDIPEVVMASDIRSSEVVQMTAEFASAPGLRFPVHMKEVAQRADPVTQTFAVRVAMKAPAEVNLLPGMTATVNLAYRRAGVLGSRNLVPVSAVFKDTSGKSMAWVLGPELTVSARAVKVGQAAGDRIEILEGLEPGDRIVTAGVNSLREGMKVRDLGDALGGGQP
jgi:multidrug efflux system membrane fusion protein